MRFNISLESKLKIGKIQKLFLTINWNMTNLSKNL